MKHIHTSEGIFSERIQNVPKSFLREILKLTSNRGDIISFAGGLPDANCFPSALLKEAADKVLSEDPYSALQYSFTEGLPALRKLISERYQSCGLNITPEQILITSGSQQGLDLLGKILINTEDKILLEKPSYLGAIQSFAVYRPQFLSVPLEDDGPDMAALEHFLNRHKVKFMYGIPDFQNPTGTRWSEEKRAQAARLLLEKDILFIEDNPYGEINFSGRVMHPVKKYLGENGVLLGTFSKTISPGLRIGWVAAPEHIMPKLIVAKQASDLHSNVLAQKMIYTFICAGHFDAHIQQIRSTYAAKKAIMIQAMQDYFPGEVRFFNPEGGMFIWATLPVSIDAYKLLERCIEKNVAFVPGKTFFQNNEGQNTLRLNFSNSTPEEIIRGIEIIGQEIRNYKQA